MRFDALAPNALVLTSASLFSTSVKRFVITSLTAAVQERLTPPMRYSEADWNMAVVQEVETPGGGSSGYAMYMASKTLAEQGEFEFGLPMRVEVGDKVALSEAAWKFVEDHKAEIGWDLVAINPPFVSRPFIYKCPHTSIAHLICLGVQREYFILCVYFVLTLIQTKFHKKTQLAIHDVSSIGTLNSSLQMWTDAVISASSPKSKEELLDSNEWVDVRCRTRARAGEGRRRG